jgi:hypothetical protein
MNYLVSRLYKRGHIDNESILELWQQLGQQTERINALEPFDTSIWKIWQTTEILSTDIQSRIYSVNGQWQPITMAVKTSPCYLRTKQVDYRTVFTIISTEKEALGSVQSLIENIYAPVELERLDRFLEKNKDLPIISASIEEDQQDREIISNFSWSKPIKLGEVLDEWSEEDLLSISALVNTTISAVKVSTLYVSKMACQLRLDVESEETFDLQEERPLINNIFRLADRVFDGKSFSAS